MNTPDLLRKVGVALYGPRWQTELAADLAVTSRTVRRWARGETEPDLRFWADLDAILWMREGVQRETRALIQTERPWIRSNDTLTRRRPHARATLRQQPIR